MNLKRSIKNTANQLFAIVEKEMKLKTRFKSGLILRLITPFFSIIMPLIVMGQLFTFREEGFGPWNGQNYVVFQFVASQLSVIFGVRGAFSGTLKTEKYWYTLQALIIAPFKRINILLGYWISHIIITSPGLILFFVLCYIAYPISIFTILSLMFLFFLIYLIFGGLGLILGILAVSQENILPYLNFGINLAFTFSALYLPFEFFPNYIQNIIDLNPLFYIISFVRLVWVENNFLLSIISHSFSFWLIIILAILSPLIGLKVFNYIFDKYGIVGY